LSERVLGGVNVEFTSGRQREAAEIVHYKKAAAVGRLLLGELNGPMEAITTEQYLKKTRKELLSDRDAARASLRGEISKFCKNNFEDVEPEDLVKLYDLLKEHRSEWFLPLTEFEELFGKFKAGVLRGAPLHSTVHISPWGLLTDFPEQHLVKDMALAFNDAVDIDEGRLTPYRTKSWCERKEQATQAEIAELIRRLEANLRTSVLSCFNLIEAFINGVSWDYTRTHDLSGLSKDNRNLLTESERPVSIVTKLVRVPVLVTGRDSGPLHQTRDPLKSFIEIVKPYRDAIVHASPFAAPGKFGGYDKLSKLYELDLRTVRTAVDVTAAVVREIYKFVHGGSELPSWFLSRDSHEKFVFTP
jgi:hypothetical protein